MKNKIIYLILCLCFLSGCTSSSSNTLTNSIVKTEKQEKSRIYDLLQYKYNEWDLSHIENIINDEEEREKFKKIDSKQILYDMNIIKDIKIIQDTGKEVILYQDKDYKDMIVLISENSYANNNVNLELIPKYEDIQKNIEENTNLYLNNFKSEENDLLSFYNKEFSFLNSHNIIFSTSYDDVSIYFENLPLSIVAYMKDDHFEKADIYYCDVQYNKIDINENTINDIIKSLEFIGYEDSVDIANTFKQSFEQNIKKGEVGEYKWEHKKDIINQNRYKYSMFSFYK